MKNLEEFINEGAWGYEPEQNDSALDYRADLNMKMLETIYDECFKKVHGGAFEEGEEVPKLDGNDAWDVISSIEHFFEKCTEMFDLNIKGEPEYEKYYYWWRLKDLKKKDIVDLYSDALSKCSADKQFINGWSEPEKMQKSLEKRASILKRYISLRDGYFKKELERDKKRAESTIKFVKNQKDPSNPQKQAEEPAGLGGMSITN